MRRRCSSLVVVMLAVTGLFASSGPLAAAGPTRAASVPVGPVGVPYWRGWDIARAVAVAPDGSGGFVLDGFGGLHGFGLVGHPAPAVPTGALPY